MAGDPGVARDRRIRPTRPPERVARAPAGLHRRLRQLGQLDRAEYLETAGRDAGAHEALGGEPEHGRWWSIRSPAGRIPLEALRVGADAFASDLNPVAVLLNKVVLEYIPRVRPTLADEVRKWGHGSRSRPRKELAEFYPKDPDGATPIAYLWARTIRCEGPGCGAEVPLFNSPYLAKNGKRSVFLKLKCDKQRKRIEFDIVSGEGSAEAGLAGFLGREAP